MYDHGNSEEQNDKMVSYACDIMDTIRWVVGDESTDRFLSGDFLNIKHLKSLVRKIEQRTQNKFSDYQNESRRGLTKEETDRATKKAIEILKVKLAKASERRKAALQEFIDHLEQKLGMYGENQE